MVISALSEDFLEDLVKTATILHANIISPYYKLVKPGLVARLHQLGVRILPWTPDAPTEWAKLIQMGVDGIITDDPKTLIDLLSHP
jgi:glycerophosphoryl diester phosphodiesterase